MITDSFKGKQDASMKSKTRACVIPRENNTNRILSQFQPCVATYSFCYTEQKRERLSRPSPTRGQCPITHRLYYHQW